MVVLSDNWWLNVFSAFVSFFLLFVVWVKRKQTYWQRRGLKVAPYTFFVGNLTRLASKKESFADFIGSTYNFFKEPTVLHGGLYMFCLPIYVPLDPGLIKHILQTDFEYFIDRGMYINEEGEPLSAHLVSLEGIKWRNLRVKLTPTFTSGKMKMMFEMLVKCSEQLTAEMDRSVDKIPVHIKDILSRFTTDIIGNCAFGIDCNSLKNPDNEFNKYLKLVFMSDLGNSVKGFISFVMPELFKKLNLRVLQPKLHSFFMKLVHDTVGYREKNNICRNDFMHLLIMLKNKGNLDDDNSVSKKTNLEGKDITLTMNELAAQAFIFFLAGFETSSTTMTFALYELASNPDIQSKLRDEVITVLKRHKKLTYDAIMEMQYMDQVVNETLRKYPPIPALHRKCVKDYKIPGTDVVLEKGTKLLIPVFGLHYDPYYHPDPQKFDPDRFSEENKNKRPQYAYLPFGEGPRNCIGFRFGLMQTKVGLSVLLKDYKFTINPKTNVPLKFDATSFIMSPEGGIWLDYKQV